MTTELANTLNKSLSIGKRSIAKRLVLAPMAFVGNIAFRELVEKFGGYGLLFTEMCSAKIIPNENLMEIEAKNTNIGENTSSIDANMEGESVNVGFNYKYMSDVFNIIGEDSICLSINGVGKPITVSGVGNDMFLYLVMPVNR